MTSSQTGTTGAGEVCRLAVHGPTSRIELAVPAHVPLADLLPTVLGHLGPELATRGLDHGGWVLQRLGEPPLDDDLGTTALGLLDGDVLHLRPHDDQLPPVDFDDLVDGVATGIAGRRDTWRPEWTRRLAFGCGGAALFAAAVALALVPAGNVAAAAALACAIALVSVAATLVRRRGEHSAAAVLVGAALGHAALAGGAAAAGSQPVTPGTSLTSVGLIVAGGFVGATATAAELSTGRFRPQLRAAAAVGAFAMLAGALGSTSATRAGVASTLLPVVLLGTYLVPTVSARLAGLRVPAPPVTQEEFQQNIDPLPAADVLERATRADTYLGSVYAALAVVTGTLLVVLALAGSTSATLTALCGSAVLLFSARELNAARHRLVITACGLIAPLTVALGLVAHSSPGGAVLIALALAAAGLGLCVAAGPLAAQRVLPHWGLAGDIAHWLCAAAIPPLALGVAGVYGRLRGLWL